jgi:aerobic C4-dicarboxylate transport protein
MVFLSVTSWQVLAPKTEADDACCRRPPSAIPRDALSPRPNRWYRVLYVQVLIAVLLGVVVGYFWPEFGKSLKPLGDAFIKLVKMIIAPIIFCTVVHGIASMST